MDPRLPEPNPACVAGVAFTLSEMAPDNAAEGIEVVRQGIFDGLMESDWEMEDAAKFAVVFIEAVAAQMEVIASAAAVTH